MMSKNISFTKDGDEVYRKFKPHGHFASDFAEPPTSCDWSRASRRADVMSHQK